MIKEPVGQPNGAPNKMRLKMQVEGEFWGTAYTYLVGDFEGKKGETVPVIANGRLLGGVGVPFITDIVKPD